MLELFNMEDGGDSPSPGGEGSVIKLAGYGLTFAEISIKRMKAPSLNLQAPEKFQAPSFKSRRAQCSVFETWSFSGAWCLDVGALIRSFSGCWRLISGAFSDVT
jgi:hypothetical protein